MKVSAQTARGREGKRARYGYVLTDDEGRVVYVSTHRFSSEETALDAGQFDIDSLNNQGEQDETTTS